MANKKILIVEDEVLMLEMMKMRFEADGFDVITAENGKDGLLKSLSDKPDLMLVDLLMPEMSGIEMIKVLRMNSDLKKTPIIVVSALGRDSDVKEAFDVGANDYIVKPYSYEDLKKKVEKLLK